MLDQKDHTYSSLLWFSLGFLVLAIYYTANPQEVLTHYHNSEITYLKARDMALGKHTYGMFFDGEDLRTPRYEFHMPEGPTYVMALWLKLGLPIKLYKIVPILTSLLAHIFLLWAIFSRYGHCISKPKLALFFSWIAYQPMIVAWSKAVDDGSFNISIMIIMISLALLRHKKRHLYYLPLGLLLGFQEFYRQPMMILLLWFVEIFNFHQDKKSLIKPLILSFSIASIAGAGVVLGVLFHIYQLALVWNHWGDAWAEMAGAALGRASIENDLNNTFYLAKMEDQKFAGAPLEWVRSKTVWKIFHTFFWYDNGRIHIWPITFVAGIVYAAIHFHFTQHLSKLFKSSTSLFLVILLFLFLIPNIWTILMPNHASIHYYYIAKDYIGFFWALCIVILELFRRNTNLSS